MAQIAVAIGRAISKCGLQVLNYNKFAAHLKHPAVVQNFNDSPSIGMSAKLTCCKFRANQIPAPDVHAFALQIAAPGNVNLLQGSHINVTQSDMNDSIMVDLEIDFPYDVKVLIKSLMYDGITEIQHRRNRIMKENVKSHAFLNLLRQTHQFIYALFHKYRIPPKNLKCNWCLLTSKIHSYFLSSTYVEGCKAAFNIPMLDGDHNSICTRIHFDLLTKIVRDARGELRIQVEAEMEDINLELEISEQNTL